MHVRRVNDGTGGATHRCLNEDELQDISWLEVCSTERRRSASKEIWGQTGRSPSFACLEIGVSPVCSLAPVAGVSRQEDGWPILVAFFATRVGPLTPRTAPLKPKVRLEWATRPFNRTSHTESIYAPSPSTSTVRDWL